MLPSMTDPELSIYDSPQSIDQYHNQLTQFYTHSALPPFLSCLSPLSLALYEQPKDSSSDYISLTLQDTCSKLTHLHIEKVSRRSFKHIEFKTDVEVTWSTTCSKAPEDELVLSFNVSSSPGSTYRPARLYHFIIMAAAISDLFDKYNLWGKPPELCGALMMRLAERAFRVTSANPRDFSIWKAEFNVYIDELYTAYTASLRTFENRINAAHGINIAHQRDDLEEAEFLAALNIMDKVYAKVQRQTEDIRELNERVKALFIETTMKKSSA